MNAALSCVRSTIRHARIQSQDSVMSDLDESTTKRTADTVDDEVARNVALVVARLRQRGVEVNDAEDAEELALLLEAVERFEVAVESRGGDLMVDEPPAGGEPEPDDERFLLPTRAPEESITAFRARLLEATPTD